MVNVDPQTIFWTPMPGDEPFPEGVLNLLVLLADTEIRSEVDFTDSTRRRLAVTRPPSVVSPRTQLYAGRRRSELVGVRFCAVASPVGVAHLGHACSPAAGPGARGLLPDERRPPTRQVQTLTGCPEGKRTRRRCKAGTSFQTVDYCK